jgi:SSS family solute:Na+ symporter
MWILIVYTVILLGIGLYDFFKARNFDDYVVAGRRQPGFMVGASLLATIIGGSATVGTFERAWDIGFPAFWWLGVGAIGLILQSIFLTRKVRRLDCYTLPDVADKTLGKPSRVIIAVIILVSWIGIIAAQFVAVSSLIGGLVENINPRLVIIIAGAVITLYSALGGQLSILKTDLLQIFILSAGLIATFVFLYFSKETAPPAAPVELFNSQFGAFSFFHLLLIVGGSYFVGPDMFSRVFTAKSEKSASRAIFISGILLIGMGIVITLIGTWAKGIETVVSPKGVMGGISGAMPLAGNILLTFGLLSAIISSADTLLVTTASIIENDILEKQNLKFTRLFVAIIGILGIIIALTESDIIKLLLSAYSVYTPGVVMPIFIGMIAYNKFTVRKWIVAGGVAIGGGLGLVSGITGIEWLSLAGMGIALVFALLSVKWKTRKGTA